MEGFYAKESSLMRRSTISIRFGNRQGQRPGFPGRGVYNRPVPAYFAKPATVRLELESDYEEDQSSMTEGGPDLRAGPSDERGSWASDLPISERSRLDSGFC